MAVCWACLWPGSRACCMPHPPSALPTPSARAACIGKNSMKIFPSRACLLARVISRIPMLPQHEHVVTRFHQCSLVASGCAASLAAPQHFLNFWLCAKRNRKRRNPSVQLPGPWHCHRGWNVWGRTGSACASVVGTSARALSINWITHTTLRDSLASSAKAAQTERSAGMLGFMVGLYLCFYAVHRLGT